jgi:DNA ligase (NAD+)
LDLFKIRCGLSLLKDRRGGCKIQVMTKGEAKKRVKKLREVINRQRYLYHVLDKQELSDEAHDSLKHELWELEKQFPDLVTKDSPTQRVGGKPLDRFEKVEHREKMLSIEDVFKEEELQNWELYIRRLLGGEDVSYFGELKIDGFAVALIYKEGMFQLGATRGDGQIGENVTQNLKTIESIPLRLAPLAGKNFSKDSIKKIEKGEVEVRGEVYMERKAFEKFNRARKKKGEDSFANPRNLAAGSIRQLDPKLAASRPLQFIAYDLVGDLGQTSHAKEHTILEGLGFRVDHTARVCKNLDEVILYWKEIEKKRDALPFEADGIVVQVNENRFLSSLGVAGKGYRGMRAMKFAGKQATTKILDIIVQIGRTGAVTPVAILKPVQVAGVKISRASLHNEDEIKRLDIRIGDTVIIERAGDVIPAVVQAIKDLRDGGEKEFRMPRYCTICKSELVKPKGEAVTRCVSKKCQAQRRKVLYHFVSRKAFNIEGLGPHIIDQLVEQGIVQDASDFFELRKEDVLPLERFGEKSAVNLMQSISASRKILLASFIYALGIRHVGKESASTLAEHFSMQDKSVSAWSAIEKLALAQKDVLQQIPDIGEVVASSIYNWFADSANEEFLKRLKSAGVDVIHTERKRENKKFAKKVFVLTGSLESMTREEAGEKIRELGGSMADAVSSKTSYIVVGKEPGLKLAKAKNLGISIVSEQEFLTLLA